jgi:hypothetical protein
MDNDQPAGQTVEEILLAAVGGLRAIIDQGCRLKHTQGLLTGLAVNAIERAVAEGWPGDEAPHSPLLPPAAAKLAP